MAGPKGQPYVHNTYGWPKRPAIIPRNSYLGRRPSLLYLTSQCKKLRYEWRPYWKNLSSQVLSDRMSNILLDSQLVSLQSLHRNGIFYLTVTTFNHSYLLSLYPWEQSQPVSQSSVALRDSILRHPETPHCWPYNSAPQTTRLLWICLAVTKTNKMRYYISMWAQV